MCLSCSDIRCGWGLRLSVVPRILEHMFDKFSRALALMREAFEDAQAGVGSLPCVDLAAEVDGAQQVINAGCAVQALRVAQYAARNSPPRTRPPDPGAGRPQPTDRTHPARSPGPHTGRPEGPAPRRPR